MSNFRPDTGRRRWSLVQVASSVLLRGGRGAADRYRCVWGALPVFRPHWFCPRSWVSVLSPSTLLRLSAALYRADPALCAVPVFGSSTKVRTRLGLRFVPFLAGAAQAAKSLSGALSPGAVHLLPSAAPASVSAHASRVRVPCVYSWELASSRHPPGRCRPSRISGSLWLETGGMFAVW